ncbi:MAG: twin-arginine translocase TatA/TatE family subunit [Pseudomonas fluorescens]|nr:MAG: twin-arginine translocase TatA/TatE family subunit [Pseudomonas fluorescens]
MLEKILVLLVVAIVALMFFGNRLPQVLGDLGKGVRAFKDGMNEGNSGDGQPKKRVKSKAGKSGSSSKLKK